MEMESYSKPQTTYVPREKRKKGRSAMSIEPSAPTIWRARRPQTTTAFISVLTQNGSSKPVSLLSKLTNPRHSVCKNPRYAFFKTFQARGDLMPESNIVYVRTNQLISYIHFK
jgi:hypothetical protein